MDEKKLEAFLGEVRDELRALREVSRTSQDRMDGMERTLRRLDSEVTDLRAENAARREGEPRAASSAYRAFYAEGDRMTAGLRVVDHHRDDHSTFSSVRK